MITRAATRALSRARSINTSGTDPLWNHLEPEASRFDVFLERRNTSALKYDRYLQNRDTENATYKDVIPLWVADMDFEVNLP